MDIKPKKPFNDFFAPQTPNAGRRLDDFRVNVNNNLNTPPKSFFDDVPGQGGVRPVAPQQPVAKHKINLGGKSKPESIGFTQDPVSADTNTSGFTASNASGAELDDFKDTSHYSLES